MGEDEKRDELMARRVGQLAPGTTVLPRHLRIAGGYCVFAFAVLAGINVYSWRNNELWPKALIISPAVLLIGVWLLVDAKALAAGTRTRQRVIVWACVLLGTGLGVGVLHHLTGRFF